MVHETKARSAADSRAAAWLRALGWSSPVWLAGGLVVWRWRRRRAAAGGARRERERFARDLHDGLGSGMHRLQRLTEMLHRADPASSSAVHLREDMLRTLQELSRTLDHTVWAVKPENDTLENLVGFLAAYAPSILPPAGIECELDLPPTLPRRALHGDTRQHLFLAVNEALTNVVKHSRARRARLRVTWTEPQLEIVVEDDGVGMTAAVTRPGGGGGLPNLRARLALLGGSCRIEPVEGGGTRLVLQARL